MKKRHYLKTECRIRNKIEIEKHYDLRYGAPGMPRHGKKKKTPEEMARQNFWAKCRYLRRLIELNFGEGDWYIVLTCRKEDRPSAEEAPKRVRAFRDRLRAEYKIRGWALKYIITCETGQKGAVHWNLILNDMHDNADSTAKLVRKLWKWGRPHFTALDDTGDYSRLAEYIVKETKNRIERGETIEKLSYCPSRNLTKPVVRTEKVRAEAWRKQPQIPRGWELVPGTLVNGKNKRFGLPYQRYTIRKKAEKEEPHEAGRHLHNRRNKGTRKGKRKGNVHNAHKKE